MSETICVKGLEQWNIAAENSEHILVYMYVQFQSLPKDGSTNSLTG